MKIDHIANYIENLIKEEMSIESSRNANYDHRGILGCESQSALEVWEKIRPQVINAFKHLG
ncbi:MAG: hypothetical protein IKL27_06330 [Oscillospiraceae bacterium]|nr:hypothetical protein [Oscillospiraceae bacterium]